MTVGFEIKLVFWWQMSGKVRLSRRKEGASGDMSDTHFYFKFALGVFVLNQDGCHFMANLLTKTYILYYICIPVFIAHLVPQLQV